MAITPLGSSGSMPAVQAEVSVPRTAAVPTTAREPAAVSQQQSPPSRQAVERAVEEIKKAMANMSSRDLHFSIDSEARMTVVRVVDTQTGDVIRQIPAEELIDIAKAMDRAQGLLLRQKA